MNVLTIAEKTMSSREIAELTGKEHKHVRRDCEAMFSELGIDANGYVQNWTHPQNGQTYPEYLLNRELVQTLITGYSIKLRHAVIQRLNELEAKQTLAIPNFTDPAEAAIAWAAEYKAKQAAQAQVLQLEHKVDELSPKAKALDSIANANGLKTIPQAAKPLGVQPEKQLRPYMKAHKWIFWGADQQYHAFAERIRAGHLKEKDRIITHKDGSQEVKVTVYVTPMGESLLAQRIDDIIHHSKQEKAA